ncbi:MAG: hypothetical protein A3E80_06010 [Chlamydiae bacterium RIFCSPHIGHO2_12_FULL_49_9]|nr:MAG: hypothetical protein A3E80_06010 [Chlamydiae bacterium RIFCSPHIGHO2_12_FULL_49_9]
MFLYAVIATATALIGSNGQEENQATENQEEVIVFSDLEELLGDEASEIVFDDVVEEDVEVAQ